MWASVHGQPVRQRQCHSALTMHVSLSRPYGLRMAATAVTAQVTNVPGCSGRWTETQAWLNIMQSVAGRKIEIEIGSNRCFPPK